MGMGDVKQPFSDSLPRSIVALARHLAAVPERHGRPGRLARHCRKVDVGRALRQNV
jgi:hypothetical protein